MWRLLTIPVLVLVLAGVATVAGLTGTSIVGSVGSGGAVGAVGAGDSVGTGHASAGASHTHLAASAAGSDHHALHVHEDAVVCTCRTALRDNGWCGACGTGYVAGVAVPYADLFEALDAHGHAIDPAAMTCSSCQTALAEDGFCTVCRWGFVHEQLYFSRLTYAFARGEPAAGVVSSCPRCSWPTGSSGWCDTCGRGFVGNAVFRERGLYDMAAGELVRLHDALRTAERCEYCAVCMYTGAACPVCSG